MRYSWESCAITGLGYCAISTEISSTIVHSRVACSKAGTSNSPRSSSWKRSRFSEARLHAVSSRNMYSEQGFEPRIGPPAGEVCHSLIVVSYCTPGSADCQAARATRSQRSRARTVFEGSPSTRR